jgi:hypothetical protein
MKRYRGTRVGETTADPTLVTVIDTDETGVEHHAALAHSTRHSPTGFNWGYAGSGPAELARCLLIDYLGTERVSGGLYQEFKARMIASLAQDRGWEITAAQIDRFLASPAAQAISTWLDDAAFPHLTDDDLDDGMVTRWIEEQEHQNRALKERYRQAHLVP